MNPFTSIKSQLSILDVISSYIPLKQAGIYWKGHCPFHNEKTASFTVSPHKEIFYCFGCHIGGDVVTFISKIENCSPFDAARHLADQHGLEMPLTSHTANKEKKNQYLYVCEKVAQWCQQKISQSPVALYYLKKRKIDTKMILHFRIGYFPSGPEIILSFIQAMAREHILIEDLLESHIIAKGKTTYYSPFEDRIIFPITDNIGRFCGFGGRIFKERDIRAKYYNSKENDYFSKGSLLFGLDRAKTDIQQTKKVFIVEGYMDCIALVQHGFINTVATLGTACTPSHLQTLSRYAQHAYVMYDGDLAGHHALLRLAHICWQAKIELSVIPLEPAEDPASLLEKGVNLNHYIEKAQNIFSFFVHTLSHGFHEKSLREKLDLTKLITRTIGQISDPLTRTMILQQASAALSIPLQSLEDAASPINKQHSPLLAPFDNDTKAINQKSTVLQQSPSWILSSFEKNIFSAIINNMRLFTEYHDQDSLLCQLSDPLQLILKKMQSLAVVSATLTFSDLFIVLSDDEKKLVSSICLTSDIAPDQNTFEQLLYQLRKNNWKQLIKNIKLEIEEAQSKNDQTRVTFLLKKFEKLKNNFTSN